MAVQLGYGGLANTNGARDFSGKTAVAAAVSYGIGQPRAYSRRRKRPYGTWFKEFINGNQEAQPV